MLGRDEQRVLRAWGGWNLHTLLAYPDDKTPPGWPWIGGQSHFDALGEERHWLDYDGKGIKVGFLGEPPALTISWAAIRAHGKGLRSDLIERLQGNLLALRQSQRDHPVFAASADAAGCGRRVRIGPVTRAQALYADECDAYERDRLEPWTRHRAGIEAERSALLDEALPLAVDSEPVDLLELLEATA